MAKKIAGATSDAIQGQIEQIKNQVDIMQEQRSQAVPDSQTERMLTEDIDIAKADIAELKGVASDDAKNESKAVSNVEAKNRNLLANILDKIASIVDEVDIASTSATKTLEQVQSEVDKIYGDQSKNETYYFKRRGL